MEWWGYCRYGNNVIIIKRKILFQKICSIVSTWNFTSLFNRRYCEKFKYTFFSHSSAIILTLKTWACYHLIIEKISDMDMCIPKVLSWNFFVFVILHLFIFVSLTIAEKTCGTWEIFIFFSNYTMFFTINIWYQITNKMISLNYLRDLKCAVSISR